MNRKDLYRNITTSLVKLINDFRTTNAPEAAYIDWDAHAQISELPTEGALMGPAGAGIAEEEDGIHVVFSFGVSTYQDPNLFRLRELSSELFGLVAPGSTIPIYDHAAIEAGGDIVPVSWMVVTTPVALTPVTKAELRSVQFVEANALLNPSSIG